MQMADINLTELERELLERAGIGGARVGVALDCLDEELLECSPGPEAIDVGLRALQERGLVRGERSSGSLTLRPRDGVHSLSEVAKRKTVHREYDGDWWVLADEGRRAIGLPPATVERSWINPSSGSSRVPPILAPWFAWRFRRGKRALPNRARN